MAANAGQKFVAKPEERLLGVVHALLHRAYKLPFSNAAEVPPSLKKELAGMLILPAALAHATLQALIATIAVSLCHRSRSRGLSAGV